MTTALLLNYKLCSPLQHTLNHLSLLHLYRLSGNGYQRRSCLSFQVNAILRQTANRPVYLGATYSSGAQDLIFLLLTDSYGLS
jgi:hypothetical protein